MSQLDVYGIGNPLIDVLLNADDEEIQNLGLVKGIMHLIDEVKTKAIFELFKKRELTYLCGGACPNTIIALANLGLKTGLSGKIGRDRFGEIYLRELLKQHVRSFLKEGDGQTGTSIIMISPDTERTMNTYLGMCREYTVNDIDRDAIKNAKFLYFTGYMWDTENQKAAIQEAIRIAKMSNTAIIFDVADPFVVEKNKQDFLRLIQDHVSIVFANRDEAKILFETRDPSEAADKLSKICRMSVVKLGDQGSLFHDGRLVHIPANRVDAIDTTGAGDTFAAGFIFGLCSQMEPKETVIFASYLASKIVMQKGAQFEKSTIDEIRSGISRGHWNYTI